MFSGRSAPGGKARLGGGQAEMSRGGRGLSYCSTPSWDHSCLLTCSQHV